ncbi:NHL repeat protein [Caulifigura coniformis]|uniref:NHL repeat protein n=1 Tax=Caulifigura coniformis TaxID=2527983 RepID=A0A517S8N8_9PLAN|nr:hypothetical protein [Caulifigura coniformis]QDT52484.1 NHL repeat protein [Caulifigura coniformis]
MPRSQQSSSRREFLARAAAGSAALLAAPAVITASKSDSQIIMGEGDFKYEVTHDFPQLPKQFTWQTTHNVAVDKAGNLYVIHEGKVDQPEHPSIFVFDKDGKYVTSFGSEFQGGGHGIEVHDENGTEYLYVCAYQQVKALAKLTLKGETVWKHHAPMKSGVYADGEDTMPEKKWGRDRFLPTNFTFLPDGDFLLVDGYGGYVVHRYDRDGNWKSHWGGPESMKGGGKGGFNTPHGIVYDARPGRTPSVAICDRANHTLQYLTVDGKYLETLTGFELPANLDTLGELLLVPELGAQVSILNGKNEVVARLGGSPKAERANRGKPETWKPGKFVHPHDACFDPEGNIYVAEWVATGRVSRLKRV